MLNLILKLITLFTKDKKNTYIQIAESYVGTQEYVGSKHNPKIIKFIAATARSKKLSDEIPWCAYFVNYVLLKTGVKGTGSGLARSFMKYGRDVSYRDPLYGDIAVFSRGRDITKGHVGFVTSYDEELREIELLGGNQKNSVCYSKYYMDDLIGLRRPV